MKIIKKRNMGWLIQEPKISSQYLGIGKTKKEAIKDFNNSLNYIFSDKRERKIYKIKRQ